MSEDPAKVRFIVIQLARWSGAALVFVGLLALAGRVEIPAFAGYILAIVGLIDALIVPTLLARRWKSPPQ